MAVKTFIQWAEQNKRLLPVYTDAEGGKDEATRRAGTMHWAYPDAYVRQQYPDGYFPPYAADALQKMGKHKPNRKAPSNEAP